jgi:hypothetical protein
MEAAEYSQENPCAFLPGEAQAALGFAEPDSKAQRSRGKEFCNAFSPALGSEGFIDLWNYHNNLSPFSKKDI